MAEEKHEEDGEERLACLDAHCHVDLYGDPRGVIERTERAGIRTVAVTNAPFVYASTEALLRGTKYFRPAIGLHPELVAEHAHELELFWEHLGTTRYVGEIGLDFVTPDKELREKQRRAFGAIVDRCGQSGGKVLTIHSRRAVKDVLNVLGTSFPGRAILHWFTGTMKELERAVSAGCYFSVNPAMVRSPSGFNLVAAMPRERVLTESDGPFVTVGERPCEPRDTGSVVQALSGVWGVDPASGRQNIEQNLRTLLGTS